MDEESCFPDAAPLQECMGRRIEEGVSDQSQRWRRRTALNNLRLSEDAARRIPGRASLKFHRRRRSIRKRFDYFRHPHRLIRQTLYRSMLF